jgi:hypothetical protein
MTKLKKTPFYGVKQIAKEYCVTIPKIRKTLMQLGIMSLDGKPTSENFAEAKEGSAFEGIYYRYNMEIVGPALDTILSPPTDDIRASFVTSRFQAEERICTIIANIGDLAHYDKINSEVIQDKSISSIYQQATFRDPHFLGGPAGLHYADSFSKMHKLMTNYRTLINPYIGTAIERVKSKKHKKEIESLNEILLTIEVWLLNVNHS